MSIPAEENAFSDQEFSGNLDVQARKGVSRREFLRLAGISGAGLALSTCTPPQVVVAEQLPASTQTSEAEQAATAAASATAKAEADKKKTQAATKTATPTSTPSPAPTATETPKPTEVPIEIVGVEVRSAAQNKEILARFQQNPTVNRLTSGNDLKRDEKGVVVDLYGRVNMPELVPAHTIINVQTNKGEQHLVIVRHPEQNPTTKEIVQQTYLVVGQEAGQYVDPIQTEPANISAVKITRRNGAWSVPNPDQSGSEMVLAKMDTEKGTVTSPFGGNFDFDIGNVDMFGLADALDYPNHGIIPFDLVYKLFQNAELSPNRPVLGSPNDHSKLPFCNGPKWIYGGVLERSMQWYLGVQHPELVKKALSQNPKVTYTRKKAPSSQEEYLSMTYTPLDMTPVFRTYIVNLGLPIGAEEAKKSGETFAGSVTIDAIPDASDRGYGFWVSPTHVNNVVYVSSGQPLPDNLISLEATAKIDHTGQPLDLDVDRYFRSQNFTSLATLRAASVQLTDPNNPQFGIIPEVFALNIHSRFHA